MATTTQDHKQICLGLRVFVIENEWGTITAFNDKTGWCYIAFDNGNIGYWHGKDLIVIPPVEQVTCFANECSDKSSYHAIIMPEELVYLCEHHKEVLEFLQMEGGGRNA